MICTRRDSAHASASSRALARRAVALCALLAAVWAAPAKAADLLDDSYLRGSMGGGPVRWDGVVIGAQLGYSSMNADFGNSTSSQIAFILRNTRLESEQSPSSWTTLPNKLTSSQSFGLFLGYNMQWDDLVLGADIAYNRPHKLEPAASDSISRSVTLSNADVDDVTITASSSIRLVDYGTFRGRAGYAFGQFLPYAVFGGAVGRFNYTTTSTVNFLQNGLVPLGFPATQTDNQSNKFGYGFLWGLGMDVAITPNMFLRGEWEYIAFNRVGDIRSTVNTVRVGLGVRF